MWNQQPFGLHQALNHFSYSLGRRMEDETLHLGPQSRWRPDGRFPACIENLNKHNNNYRILQVSLLPTSLLFGQLKNMEHQIFGPTRLWPSGTWCKEYRPGHINGCMRVTFRFCPVMGDLASQNVDLLYYTYNTQTHDVLSTGDGPSSSLISLEPKFFLVDPTPTNFVMLLGTSTSSCQG